MSPPEAEIVSEVANRLQAELPLLNDHLRLWLESHRTRPREISVSADPESAGMLQLWLVTDHIGENDASVRVV